jgi:hypothetical protein
MSNSPASSPVLDRHSRVKNTKAWFFGWLSVAIGLSGWIARALNLPELFQVGKFLGIFTAIAISVVIHELAHFTVGRMLGRKPWCLRIGHGKDVFDKEFDSFRLILKSLPYSGAVYPYVRGARWKQFAAVSAAPFSNAVLAVIAFYFVRQPDDAMDYSTIPMQMLIANAYLLTLTIIPFYSSIGPNDGMILFHLLRGTSPKRVRSAGQPSPSWFWMVKHHKPEELLNGFREQLKNPKLSPAQRCWALDVFATCVLMFGANEFLAEADQCSEELLRLQPNEISNKGTRGGVLVEKGDLPAGIAMLEEVMNSPSKNDRAISASFLALAHWKQGNRDEAKRWIGVSREIDSRCASMWRIAKLIEQKPTTES